MRLNEQKGIEVLLYIIQNNEGSLSFSEISRICYEADKHHLSEYGRFLYWEIYYISDYGPAPSFLSSLIKDKENEVVKEVNGKVLALRSADILQLSKSDIKCLKIAFERKNSENDENYGFDLGEIIPFEFFVENSKYPEALREYIFNHEI